ncbi:hypothetical protein G3567_08420 [Psychroflexus sp. YR1-1]|uniref:Uncharacterized protein n=1 Tax=Psychroflexus aurantiacus TaxID=2709310 RepID=A0A6B3R4S5_9FLAO|nr:hypothetical protein [Psychroflexus aurantiacus]NEV94167.1 hypothetical protein [Psychroflexus aurantiacus]
MKILLHILTPIGAFIINLLLGLIIPIITLPLTWLLSKIYNNPSMYIFRPDMFIQGILRGILAVYITSYLLSLFNTEIGFWWIFLTFVFLSFLSINAWDNTKPKEYEFSLNVSPIFGFIIGLFII